MNVEISGAPLVNNHVIMGYVTFQNPDVDGQFQSFTCASRYWREGITDIPKWYEVKNFYGRDTFGTLIGPYDKLNSDEFIEKGPWRANDSDPEYQYLSSFADGKSTQNCSASRIMYETGSPYQMELKNGVTYQVYTGYKIWYSTGEYDTEATKDAEPFEFMYTDFGKSLAVTAASLAAVLLGIVF